jgi:hypothetical protein
VKASHFHHRSTISPSLEKQQQIIPGIKTRNHTTVKRQTQQGEVDRMMWDNTPNQLQKFNARFAPYNLRTSPPPFHSTNISPWPNTSKHFVSTIMGGITLFLLLFSWKWSFQEYCESGTRTQNEWCCTTLSVMMHLI